MCLKYQKFIVMAGLVVLSSACGKNTEQKFQGTISKSVNGLTSQQQITVNMVEDGKAVSGSWGTTDQTLTGSFQGNRDKDNYQITWIENAPNPNNPATSGTNGSIPLNLNCGGSQTGNLVLGDDKRLMGNLAGSSQLCGSISSSLNLVKVENK